MPDLVVVGLGELGTLLASAALKLGWRVTPGTRSVPVEWLAVPRETPVLVAVGEEALPVAIASVPIVRRPDVVLLQNELFPSVWHAAGLACPTVMVPWFSKKKGRPVELSRPTLVHGKWSSLVEELHRALEIPVTLATEAAERDQALVSKYAFILAINALGLVENLTLGEWLKKDPARVVSIVEDARLLGEAQLGAAVDAARVRHEVLEAFAALAHYPSRGRTAAARIKRATELAVRLGVQLTAIA